MIEVNVTTQIRACTHILWFHEVVCHHEVYEKLVFERLLLSDDLFHVRFSNSLQHSVVALLVEHYVALDQEEHHEAAQEEREACRGPRVVNVSLPVEVQRYRESKQVYT